MNLAPVQQIDQTGWEQNYKFLHLLTRKAINKAMKYRLPLEYDDLFQETCIAWMRARKTFNPNLGFKFITYLGNVVERDLYKILNKTMQRQMGLPTKDFLSEEAMMEAIDEAVDPTPAVHDQIEMQQAAYTILRRLSPHALLVFQLTQDPPPEVKREYIAWQLKGKAKNDKGRSPKIRVPVSFMCRVLLPRVYGVSEGHGRTIEMEINYVMQYARDL